MSVCPLEPTPFLSPLLQVMILVTPMMLPVNLFGLRLPEVCGEWPMSLMGSCILQETTSRGGRRARVLYTDSPPSPPPSLEIGTEVPDHQRQRRPKANLLEPLEGQKMGFHPMCLYSKYSVFSGEPNDG